MPFNVTPKNDNFRLTSVPSAQSAHEEGLNGSFTARSGQWREAHFIPDGDEAGFKGRNILPTFLREVLGYSTKDLFVAGKLKRFLPARHADGLNLWASGISSITPVKFTDKRTGKVRGIGGSNSFRSGYSYLKCVVDYSTPNYRIRSDEERDAAGVLFNEWDRFIVLENYEISTEFMQVKRGSFRYVAGTPGQNEKGIPDSSGGMVVRLVKNRMTLLWVQIPDDGLFDKGGFDKGGRPFQLERAKGRVNTDEWHGYPKGTLLLESAQPIPHVMPISGVAPSVGDELVRSWDVRLVMTFFDPEAGTITEGIPPVPIKYRGHNLVLNWFDNLWYMAHVKGQPNNQAFRRYRETPFADIFKMN